MSLDTVVLDTLSIAKAVRFHLNEVNCNHTIQEIVKEALGPVASTSRIPNRFDGVIDNQEINYQHE